MDETKKNIIVYVKTASELAETLRRSIQRGLPVDEKTVLALNAFVMAANNIKDVTDDLQKEEIQLN